MLSIKLVRGLEQAKQAFKSIGPLDLTSLPPEVHERTAKLFGSGVGPEDAVRRILNDVKAEGDVAVRRYTKLLDGVVPKELEVPRERWHDALSRIPETLVSALKHARDRVRHFHELSLPRSWVDFDRGLGELVVPLERVGVYVPGGSAAYPSTVIMTAVPAKVAGVKEVVMATPPGSDGAPHLAVLAAAAIAGVDRLFCMGGVPAIAALAYGTESVPRVFKLCGPGSIFVSIAKTMVFGHVDIDGVYGPTETVVVADDSAPAAFCAADLLAQAEHDVLASPILITNSLPLAVDVEKELENQLAKLNRSDTMRKSLSNRGMLVLVNSLDEALELANHIAPEHLCLLVRDAWQWAAKVRNAGGVFLGQFSPEVIGDYVAGPSHVMPTGGTARFRSSLGVHHFIKHVPLVGISRQDFDRLASVAIEIATSEGLSGHAHAIEVRLNSDKKSS